MGPIDAYRRGYQEGYENGFRDGYRDTARRDGYRNWPHEGWRGDNWQGGGGSPAYRFGYEDGASMARGDFERGKKFNSKPRGQYDDRDHGYRREYGDRGRYQAEYTDGYRAGYSESYRY